MLGSSPQVRGKPHEGEHLTHSPRLIPAGAGKTRPRRSWCRCRAAHPRRCGENLAVLSSSVWQTGSSPQVRGKLAQQLLPMLSQRLIPAGAGKTRIWRYGHSCHSAHPRRCGENFPFLSGQGRVYGSSPQVRGKHIDIETYCELDRLIPAGAGKTGTNRAR